MTPAKTRRCGPGRPADPALDDALVDAAVAVLAERGYAGLTTAEVARRAGASTASLYRRWRTKDDLIVDAAERLADAAVPIIDTGEFADDLRALLAHKQQALAGNVGRAFAVLLGQAVHDPQLAQTLQRVVVARTEERIAEMLTAARGRGADVAHVDPAALTVLMVAAALAPSVAPALGASTAEPDGFAQLLVRAAGG